MRDVLFSKNYIYGSIGERRQRILPFYIWILCRKNPYMINISVREYI